MIYREGAIILSAASHVVLGEGTKFLNQVNAGAILTLGGVVGAWHVARVVSDVELHLARRVDALPAGASLKTSDYALSADFTPTIHAPYPNRGEIDNASVLERTFAQFDKAVPVID